MTFGEVTADDGPAHLVSVLALTRGDGIEPKWRNELGRLRGALKSRNLTVSPTLMLLRLKNLDCRGTCYSSSRVLV